MAQGPHHAAHAQGGHHAAAAAGVNDGMSMSENGRLVLSRREGQGGPAGNPNGYYNDVANNCTYGAGTLAHHGPCTVDEIARQVDDAGAAAELTRRIHAAERRVRQRVLHRALNQNQFDALVSAVYNSGAEMDHALEHVDNNDDSQAIARIRSLVYVHNRDAHGQVVGAPVRVPGLVNRRESEVEQFDQPVGHVGGDHR